MRLTMLHNRSAAQAPESGWTGRWPVPRKLCGCPPTRPQTYFELGQSLLFERNLENALASFRHAVVMAPESFEV
jgi:hypothetical protein